MAEIVSAQAIAQQEKLEYGPDDDRFEGNGDIVEADEEDEPQLPAKRLSA